MMVLQRMGYSSGEDPLGPSPLVAPHDEPKNERICDKLKLLANTAYLRRLSRANLSLTECCSSEGQCDGHALQRDLQLGGRLEVHQFVIRRGRSQKGIQNDGSAFRRYRPTGVRASDQVPEVDSTGTIKDTKTDAAGALLVPVS
jgi:hypothetical protein